MQHQPTDPETDSRWEQGSESTKLAMNKPSTSLPPIHDVGTSSMLPGLVVPSVRVPTPPLDAHKHDLNGLSRLPMPRQRYNVPPSSSSQLKFPSLVKPQHRMPPLAADKSSKCNQEEENNHSAEGEMTRNADGNNADDEQDGKVRQTNSSRLAVLPGVVAATRPVGDKNRDFIRELEEKKRKQKEDEVRKERRKQKLHEKLSRKILEEAAQARQKQQTEPEETEIGEPAEQPGDTQQQELADAEDDKESGGEEARKRKEKVRRQKRLLKKQQALLEQMQVKKKEKQEELELEKEKERRKQEKVKKAILTAIYDANARHQAEEEGGGEEEARQNEHEDEEDVEEEEEGPEEVAKPVKREANKIDLGLRKSTNGPTLIAAGSAAALLRDRKETSAPAPQPVQQEDIQEEQKQRAKEQRDTINRKQQEYLQKLADQRKQKQKEEEDTRILQEKKKKKIQQDALLRHQEVAKQQQEAAAAAAQREKEESSSEKAANAGTLVDVEAMVARLSKLKDRDSQVIPEARDFASWKKRHGVRADQSVFCMTGCYPVIREELEKRGWYYNQEKVSPFFDLKWSLKSDDLKAYKLEKHQYVNHFFQNTAITTKVGLLHNLRNMVWHQNMDVDTIFPRAYDLNEPRDMETFVQDFRYGFAEGLLKELAKIYMQRKKKTSAIKANLGIVDVLLSIARKKVNSKRPDSDDEEIARESEQSDLLDESIDDLASPGVEELVTDLQWEALTKCQVDKPGTLRASLVYKRKVFADDRADALLGIESGGMSSQSGAAGSVDTVLSALEKKQQRQVEKQRAETFNREKARLGQLLAKVETIDEPTLQEVVRLAKVLEKLCPQFRINGGWDLPLSDPQNNQPADPESLVSSKSRNIWIVKPAGMSRGRGIRVFNNLDLLLEYADVENHKECQWVAQKYIENPLLVCKRKFDIRQWVLVTGWDPLTVWFYQDCYLRFSSEEYSMDDLSDQYVHLTNNSIQKYSDKFNDVYTTDDGEIRVEGNMLHSDDFKQYIRAKLGKPDGFWESEIQIRIKDIVVASLQCVQDMVQHRSNCCELFGYDFMIDTDLTPWLIEVNSSPACDYSTPTAERYVKTGLAGIIKVIVDHREYEQKKKSSGGGATGGMTEPDTGCWQRIHKAEFIGKPVSSFGADFFVKGAKMQKTRGRSSNKAGATGGTGSGSNNGGSSQATKSSNNIVAGSTSTTDKSDGTTKQAGVSGGGGGFMIVEEDEDEDESDDREDEEGNEQQDSPSAVRHDQRGFEREGGSAVDDATLRPSSEPEDEEAEEQHDGEQQTEPRVAAAGVGSRGLLVEDREDQEDEDPSEEDGDGSSREEEELDPLL